MALVVKKIGGQNYLYEQHSHRVDGKVQTREGRFLGRFDGALSRQEVKDQYLGKHKVEMPERKKEVINKLFVFQDEHQEKIIHSKWIGPQTYRFILEGSGDVFRELTKPEQYQHYNYINEKLTRIENYIQEVKDGKLHDDDTRATSLYNNPEHIEELDNLWSEQPYVETIQKIAIELNQELTAGHWLSAEDKVKEIRKYFEDKNLKKNIQIIKNKQHKIYDEIEEELDNDKNYRNTDEYRSKTRQAEELGDKWRHNKRSEEIDEEAMDEEFYRTH